ncbi:hypothetical protein MKY48_14200 [Paenibacillus sp. FSL W8-0187]|uniref:hypothetical protein n=1 Tax=Paenibacillus sp. FSL W8-0187 TaxID=2921710 RepID=UPI0030D81738
MSALIAVIASEKEKYEELAEETKHEVELTDIHWHWAKESIQQLMSMRAIKGTFHLGPARR